MKRNLIFLLGVCLVLSLLLSGCNIPSSEGKNPVYLSAQDEFDFIIDAIEKKDTAAIKEKFSEYACNNIDDIDRKIERLVDEFPGYDGDVRISDFFRRHSNYGKITYAYTPSYDFKAGDATYRMRIIYYVEADEEPEKLGWYSIQLYKRYEESYSSDMYTHDVEDDPDILLWDYTK